MSKQSHAAEEKKVETPPAAPPAPAAGTEVAVYDYGADGATGFEHVEAKMYIVPLLDILQPGSSEVQKDSLPNAKAGNFVIRAFGEVFDGKKGIEVIPCGVQEVLNEWIPKDAGGGLVAVHDPNGQFAKDARAHQKFGKIKMKNGHELVETHYLYCLMLREDGSTNMISIPFTSTKIPRCKTMLTKARGVTAIGPKGAPQNLPLYGHVYVLKTTLVEKKGHAWQNFADIGWKGGSAASARIAPTLPLYIEARTFATQVKDKLVKIDTNDLQAATANDAGTGDDDGGEVAKGADSNIPF